jgi:hypothetical protein
LDLRNNRTAAYTACKFRQNQIANDVVIGEGTS